MELKKSISDTERALRSYGSVSETAWTTDKGESHASKHLFVISTEPVPVSVSELNASLRVEPRAGGGEAVNV